MARFHVRAGIAHEKAVLGLGAEGLERAMDDVGCGFAGEAVCALDVVEVLYEAELFEDRAGRRCSFGRRSAFAAAEDGQRFGDAGIHARQLVTAGRIDLTILPEQIFQAALRCVRKEVAEEIEEMATDVALEVIESDGRAIGASIEHLPDCAADVLGGVQQGAVDVEQINAKRRDHAGCEPSLRPGTRRPESGRMTCCVWSAESFGLGGSASRDWPLMSCITSLPSRISRT